MSLRFWSGEVGGLLDVDELTPWVVLRLDGSLFPSDDAPFVIKSMSGGVGFDIDRRKRKNRSGRKKVATGSKSPQWSMTFAFWTPEQYRGWSSILTQINPKLAANRSKARSIYHPFLADFEITQAFIFRIDFPQIDTQSLFSEVTIHFEDVGASDKDDKKTLKPTNDPNANAVAIDKDFVSGEAAIPTPDGVPNSFNEGPPPEP